MILHKFKCISYKFSGINERSINQHLSRKSYTSISIKKHVATGLSSDISSTLNLNKDNLSVSPSYVFKQYLTDGTTDLVYLDIIYDTLEGRCMIIKNSV